MNKYIKYIVESFFDDIENDIISDNIIDSNTELKLYCSNWIYCNTPIDYANFFIEHSHIAYIINKMLEYFNINGFNIIYTFKDIFKQKDIKDKVYNIIRIRKNKITFKSTIENVPEFEILLGRFSVYNSIILSILDNKISLPINISGRHGNEKMNIHGMTKFLSDRIKELIEIFNDYKKHINESFFDDIENDINDNIISTLLDNTFYNYKSFIECETYEDFTNFFYYNMYITLLYKKLNNLPDNILNNLDAWLEFKCNYMQKTINELNLSPIYNIQYDIDNDIIVYIPKIKNTPKLYIIVDIAEGLIGTDVNIDNMKPELIFKLYCDSNDVLLDPHIGFIDYYDINNSYVKDIIKMRVNDVSLNKWKCILKNVKPLNESLYINLLYEYLYR